LITHEPETAKRVLKPHSLTTLAPILDDPKQYPTIRGLADALVPLGYDEVGAEDKKEKLRARSGSAGMEVDFEEAEDLATEGKKTSTMKKKGAAPASSSKTIPEDEPESGSENDSSDNEEEEEGSKDKTGNPMKRMYTMRMRKQTLKNQSKPKFSTRPTDHAVAVSKEEHAKKLEKVTWSQLHKLNPLSLKTNDLHACHMCATVWLFFFKNRADLTTTLKQDILKISLKQAACVFGLLSVADVPWEATESVLKF